MNHAIDMRAQIDAALEAKQNGRAISLLKHYWSSEPSLANAPFVIDRFAKAPVSPAAVSCEMLILRSFTVEPIVPLVRAAAACWGVDLNVRLGQFNSYVQEMIDPNSTLYRDPTDVVVLALQTRDIAPELWSRAADMNNSAIDAVVKRVVNDYRRWIETIRTKSAAHVLIHNLEKPYNPASGIYDSQCLNGQMRAIERIDLELVALRSVMPGVHVLDYDGLTARHGKKKWSNEKKWITARLPIAADCLIHLADEWVRYLLPIKGRQAKCLACDLDNTLWGGVIGEDTIHGIKLGAEYPGAAYQELQRAILDLARRGVIVAVCSKNNEADAMEVIERHPDMLLRREDFASLRINWANKVQNLREIAAELNIGIDSLVLIDDEPVERELVREMLPEVTVIDIDPRDPFGHADALRRCPLFERLELSAEDRLRNQLYAQQRQRVELQSSATTVEDYYRSLEMVATIGLADEATRQRVAQLTQKTNQLNMTGRRYSEQGIQELIDDPKARVYWVRLADRFGDNGIIGVMIVREVKDDWEIDTFLMSCRVIGRTVETAMLGTLVEHARQRGVNRLIGPFRATPKNAPARDIFALHEFRCVEEGEEGSLWELDISSATLRPPEWIQCRFLERQGVSE